MAGWKKVHGVAAAGGGGNKQTNIQTNVLHLALALSSTAMERSLGLTALRLPGSLEQLAATPLFAAAAAEEQPPDLTAWLQAARQQTLTQLDWAVVLRAFQGQLQASQALQLASLLSWAAKGARQQLEEVNAGTAAADAGDPRRRQALQNSLKLSLFFLCSLARGEGTATASGAQHPHAAAVATGGQQKRAKAAGGDGAAAALAALRLRRDALLAAGGIEEAVAADRALLPAVSDLRAACRLVRAAVLHCLVHPLPVPAGGGDRSAKDLAEACFQAVAGGWPLSYACQLSPTHVERPRSPACVADEARSSSPPSS